MAAHTSHLAWGSDSYMSFKESYALNLFIVLPHALPPREPATSPRLASWTLECETPPKTLEQVNKTHKQQVCALIIAPSTLGARSATCPTNVLVNTHSQNVRSVGTGCLAKMFSSYLNKEFN